MFCRGRITAAGPIARFTCPSSWPDQSASLAAIKLSKPSYARQLFQVPLGFHRRQVFQTHEISRTDTRHSKNRYELNHLRKHFRIMWPAVRYNRLGRLYRGLRGGPFFGSELLWNVWRFLWMIGQCTRTCGRGTACDFTGGASGNAANGWNAMCENQ